MIGTVYSLHMASNKAEIAGETSQMIEGPGCEQERNKQQGHQFLGLASFNGVFLFICTFTNLSKMLVQFD